MSSLGTLDRATDIAPVFDAQAVHVLTGIFSSLDAISKQLKVSADQVREQNDEIRDQLEDNDSNEEARSKASEKNSRAVDKALKDIAGGSSRLHMAMTRNSRAVDKALRGIIGGQRQSRKDSNADRATQKALFGKMDKNTKASNSMFAKFKDGLNKMLGGLTDFLKDTLNKSLKQQTELAKMMRMQYLTSAQKDKIQKMANSAQAETEHMFGIKVAKEDIATYYKELIAGGKDLELMTTKQRAAYAALRQSGVDDERAYLMATSANAKIIREYVNKATDPKLRNAMNNSAKALDDVALASIGINDAYRDVMDGAVSVAKYYNAATAGAAEKAITYGAKYKHGLMESTDAMYAAVVGPVKDMNKLGSQYKSAMLGMTDTMRRGLHQLGGSASELAIDAARGSMMTANGADVGVRVRSGSENAQSLDVNTKNGTLFYELEKAFGKIDNSMGGIFGQLANRMDEVFGDSADVGKLVGTGFKLVTGLLAKIVFNTTGGVLGFLFRIGSTLLAVAMIKKIIENKDKFKVMFAPVVDALKKALPPGLIDTFSNIFSTVRDVLKVFAPLAQTITKFISTIAGKISETFGPITSGISNAASALTSVSDGLSGLTGNEGESTSDKIIGYFKKALPKIGDFFKNTIAPVAESLIKMFSDLIPVLWENLIKPLVPAIWDLFKENWPLVLGAFAIKFLPDILLSAIPKLIGSLVTTVLPKLISLCIAHPVIGAVVAGLAALAVGGKWLWDRQEEKARAEEDARAYADAQSATLFAGSDYYEAYKKLGPDDPKTKELEKIYKNTIDIAEEARKKKAASAMTARLGDTDAKDLTEAIQGGLLEQIEAQEKNVELLRKRAAENPNSESTKNALAEAERRLLLEKMRRDNYLYNASSATDFIDNEDFDKKWGQASMEELQKKYAELQQKGATDVAVSMQALVESGIISAARANNLVKEIGSKYNDEEGRINKMGQGDYYGSIKNTNEFLQDMNISQIREIAKSVSIDTEGKDKQTLIQELVNSNDMSYDRLTSAIVNLQGAFDASKLTLFNNFDKLMLNDVAKLKQLAYENNIDYDNLSLAEVLDQLKENMDIDSIDNVVSSNRAVLDAINKNIQTNEDKTKFLQESLKAYSTSGIKIDEPTLKLLASLIELKEEEFLKKVETPHANGGYVDKETHALIGENGSEVILPLDKPKEMEKVAALLTQREKNLVLEALYGKNYRQFKPYDGFLGDSYSYFGKLDSKFKPYVDELNKEIDRINRRRDWNQKIKNSFKKKALDKYNTSVVKLSSRDNGSRDMEFYGGDPSGIATDRDWLSVLEDDYLALSKSNKNAILYKPIYDPNHKTLYLSLSGRTVDIGGLLSSGDVKTYLGKKGADNITGGRNGVRRLSPIDIAILNEVLNSIIADESVDGATKKNAKNIIDGIDKSIVSRYDDLYGIRPGDNGWDDLPSNPKAADLIEEASKKSQIISAADTIGGVISSDNISVLEGKAVDASTVNVKTNLPDGGSGECKSCIKDPSGKHKHELRPIDYDNLLPQDGISTPGDDLATVKKILNLCKTREEQAHALYDIILPNRKHRKEDYETSKKNLGITEGKDGIKGTYAERALAAGASQIGRPYLLESMNRIGLVCNELVNYAMAKSGVDRNGFRVWGVNSTFQEIMSGKGKYAQMKIHDEYTPQNVPPGMVFFQDSKTAEDGTFAPGHTGLVWYGHKRLHSAGGSSNYSNNGFMLGWQSNRGVVIDDFPTNARFKFGELPALFAKTDGSKVEYTAYAGGEGDSSWTPDKYDGSNGENGGAGGLSADQMETLYDAFGFNSESIEAYTSRWLSRQLNPSKEARKNDRTAQDLNNFVEDEAIEKLKKDKNLKKLIDKDNAQLSIEDDPVLQTEFYRAQYELMKEGMGVVSDAVHVKQRMAASAATDEILKKDVREKGDIFGALTEITRYLKNIANSSKKPTPVVGKPTITQY